MASIKDLYEKTEHVNAPKGKNKDKTPWSNDKTGNIDISSTKLDSIRGVVNEKKYSDNFTD